jgi:UDP-N-acetylmuramoyl-tripeptide--D-alanyl-D-alanine ligase
MLNLQLSAIAAWTEGRLLGDDRSISSVSTDTRKLAEGALFVALRGERHDAHEFVAVAGASGAAAVLVEREVETPLAQIVVADSQLALGRIAAEVRARREICVIGITGSNGKTTVKSLLAGILSRHAPTHFSSGSFNNEIGLPLTLLDMPQDSRYAVLEMGAGKPGDIAYLMRIAQAQVGLVNNIAPAHLERMGTIDRVAETKGALYTMLPTDGIAVINADDRYADYFRKLAGERRSVCFGLSADAEVSARFDTGIAPPAFTLVAAQGSIRVDLPLQGRHNLLNALAAASLALAVDVPLETIRDGLQAAVAVAGRSARRSHPSGATVIDDSYNANPASFAAAIDTLAECAAPRILVVGDMRELGRDGRRLHAEIGALARARGIERLYAVGELSAAAAREFGSQAHHYADQASLIDELRGELAPGATVLVKGSRGSAMDKVVSALFATGSNRGGPHAA